MNHFTLFKKIISAGSIVLDVGAHKGGYSRSYSEIVGQKGKVFSFEPHPDLYSYLENAAVHCPMNNIFPFAYAVSDTIGQAMLFSASEEFGSTAYMVST
mgnify:CR=1 FL=1